MALAAEVSRRHGGLRSPLFPDRTRRDDLDLDAIFGCRELRLDRSRARASVPAPTHSSHTAFIAAKSPMSGRKIVADRIFVLSEPCFRRAANR
jgi:hypothetical protein